MTAESETGDAAGRRPTDKAGRGWNVDTVVSGILVFLVAAICVGILLFCSIGRFSGGEPTYNVVVSGDQGASLQIKDIIGQIVRDYAQENKVYPQFDIAFQDVEHLLVVPDSGSYGDTLAWWVRSAWGPSDEQAARIFVGAVVRPLRMCLSELVERRPSGEGALYRLSEGNLAKLVLGLEIEAGKEAPVSNDSRRAASTWLNEHLKICQPLLPALKKYVQEFFPDTDALSDPHRKSDFEYKIIAIQKNLDHVIGYERNGTNREFRRDFDKIDERVSIIHVKLNNVGNIHCPVNQDITIADSDLLDRCSQMAGYIQSIKFNIDEISQTITDASAKKTKYSSINTMLFFWTLIMNWVLLVAIAWKIGRMSTLSAPWVSWGS